MEGFGGGVGVVIDDWSAHADGYCYYAIWVLQMAYLSGR